MSLALLNFLLLLFGAIAFLGALLGRWKVNLLALGLLLWILVPLIGAFNALP